MTAATATCLHCLTPLAAGNDRFCCTGCRLVYALLHDEKLDRYYDLRGGSGRAATGVAANGESAGAARRDRKWLEAIEARLKEPSARGALSRVDLDVQGLHCTGCVWLLRELFRRHPGGASIVVNPAIGRVHLTASPSFDLRGFVADVERFGYLFGPPLKSERRPSQDLLWRMGLCIAIAMNTMIFAIAIYAGLASGPLFATFSRINLALSLVSVAVGGSVFIVSAARALRRGVLHLDLPIALGIVLAFAGSVQSYLSGGGNASFVDTLNVFIALMLVGRWLQQRVLERNRLELLESDGVDGLLTRRWNRGRAETVRCTQIAAGDVLPIAPGDLLPVDATADVEAPFSLDWINGESSARAIAAGETIPAGAFYAGESSIDVRARSAFEASPLIDLLRSPAARENDSDARRSWWQRFTRWYVAGVLLAAAIGFVGWALATHDLVRAAGVATAVLIVTCPCAFGLATPLAYDLVAAGLRRAGLFVRSPGFFDRASRVHNVVFDKTGTVTTGALELIDASPLAALDPSDRAVLYTLSARSHHPKSVAVRGALERLGATAVEGAQVTEHAGKGVKLTIGRHSYRLGAPLWATWHESQCDLAFGRDGVALCELSTREALRPDAAREVHELEAKGYGVWLLSGDADRRVQEVAREIGIPERHAFGDKSPIEKRAWLQARDRHDALMIGDGINDSLAVEHAFCSGTPAIDRPFMAARSDFYFVTPGLRPIRLALDASRALAHVRTRNLCIALAYNAIAITLAYAGLMSPLVCAILMPVSSLTTIAATAVSLNRRSPLWRS